MRIEFIYLVLLSIASLCHSASADDAQQMLITLHDSKATLLVDGTLPLESMTAAISAATELGYDGVNLSQVPAKDQRLSKAGVSFLAVVDENVVTFRSHRPVPSKVVICFLRHLKSASITQVRFDSAPSKQAAKKASSSPVGESPSNQLQPRQPAER